MSWNYRIVRYADGSGYGLHEVYYNEDDEPDGMTEEAVGPTGDTPAEVIEELAVMIADAAKDFHGPRGVFDEPPAWRDDAGGK